MTGGEGGSAVLQARHVTKVFNVKDNLTVALEDVSLDVRAGEFISLVGPSGCGKTTLLRILDHLTEPDVGEVLLQGRPLTSPSRAMAFVFQEVALLPWRSVLRNVAIGLEARGMSRRQARSSAMEALSLVGLDKVADRPPYTLSGGMQQRVGIARALATRPEVLLMDEPFAHLDNFTRESLQIELQQLCSTLSMTTVFVTHDIDEAIYLSDRIALFRSAPGRIVDVIDVPFDRPRRQSEVRGDPRAIALREYVIDSLGVRSEREPASAER